MNRVVAILAIALLLGGCAHQAPTTQPVAIAPATQPALRGDPKSFLSLDEILPKPELGPPLVVANAAPPVQALVLYAKGMDDLFNQHPYDAVEIFNEALRIDPDSYELYYALGRAHLDRIHQPNDRSFDAFERAAAIRPDNLDIHLLLGREYLADGKIDKSIEHLRLAMNTSQYSDDEAGAASVDFFLARALQQQGYDRAALDTYTRLVHRLNNSTLELRNDPDVGFLASSPDLIWEQIAALYDKRGQFAEALDAYIPLASADPANFQLQAKVVQLLAELGRADDATRAAADLVSRFRASTDSVKLLRDVYRTLGREQDIVDALQRLRDRDPKDRAILFALADVLVDEGKFESARQMLDEAAAKNPADQQLAGKLFHLFMSRDDAANAAKVLIVYLAADPDSLREINPWFVELLRPASGIGLRISTLKQLQVAPSAEPARLYLLSRVADIWQRDVLSRQSLKQAVAISPPFAPAYRALAADDWDQNDLDDKQKQDATAALADAAQKQGAASLAAEVRGISAAAAQDSAEAEIQFALAQKLGATSPDFQLTYAEFLFKHGQPLRCEQMLWKLVADRPRYDEAWESLHGFYERDSRDADALKVLSRWLKADPGSTQARLRQAFWYATQGQLQVARTQLDAILQDRPDLIEVLQSVDSFYRQLDQSDQFFQKLETLRAQQPRNFTLINWLVDDYDQAHRSADAIRLLDDTRAKVGDDPELLYLLAGMYERVGQTQSSQDLLAGVIQKDPTNGPASNDLGFAWADAGKNLDRAEQLIRVAVAAEPDNQAFLDSMGWVLYKRGKFQEASNYFQMAIGPAALPDPEILDHFGDALYRLGKTADAQKQWQRSLDRLESEKLEHGPAAQLQLQLKEKLKAAAAAKPVDVAPVVENPSSAISAQ